MENNLDINQKHKVPIKRKIGWQKILVVLGIMILMLGAGYIIKNRKVNNEGDKSIPDWVFRPSEVDSNLKLLLVEPKSGPVNLAGTTNAVILAFSEPINTDTISTSSTPKMTFNITVHPDPIYGEKIILQPKSPWVEGQKYRIVVKGGIESVNSDNTYDNDIILEYEILPISPPIYDRPS